ncbi:hypothetical protein BH10PSE13_BH10PSE13_09710 [soil metagenome]
MKLSLALAGAMMPLALAAPCVAADKGTAASKKKPATDQRLDAAFDQLDEADKLGVANFAHCIVARHAGDMRWFALVVGERSGVPAERIRGAMQNTANAMRASCPSTEAHSKEALTYAAVLLRFHPGAVNLPTETDALAQCVTSNMLEESVKFLDGADAAMEEAIEAKAEDKPVTFEPKTIMDAAFGGKLAKPCKALAPAKGALDFNQFYSHVNWVVRARDALARAAATASQAKGR